MENIYDLKKDLLIERESGGSFGKFLFKKGEFKLKGRFGVNKADEEIYVEVVVLNLEGDEVFRLGEFKMNEGGVDTDEVENGDELAAYEVIKEGLRIEVENLKGIYEGILGLFKNKNEGLKARNDELVILEGELGSILESGGSGSVEADEKRLEIDEKIEEVKGLKKELKDSGKDLDEAFKNYIAKNVELEELEEVKEVKKKGNKYLDFIGKIDENGLMGLDDFKTIYLHKIKLSNFL